MLASCAQMDVLGLTTWQVRCKAQVKVKKDGKTTKQACGEHDAYGDKCPKVCPTCGSEDVAVEFVGGPVPRVLKYLKAQRTKTRRKVRKEKRRA